MKGKGKGDEKGGFKGLLKGSFEQAKGKGKSDYGGSKGEHGHLKGNRKGSGKPMYGGCWHCGGGHFARDCPAKGGRCWGRGAGGGLLGQGAVCSNMDCCTWLECTTSAALR